MISRRSGFLVGTPFSEAFITSIVSSGSPHELTSDGRREFLRGTTKPALEKVAKRLKLKDHGLFSKGHAIDGLANESSREELALLVL